MTPDAAIAALIQVLPEPSYLLTGGRILAANRSAAELSGTSEAALIGTPFQALVNAPPERVGHYLSLCARTRQMVPGAFRWRGPQGEDVEVRCDGAVVVPRSGERDAVVFLRCRPKVETTDRFVLLNQKILDLSKEILERKKAERQRDELLVSERAARLEAERNSRMKDEFLATLSHELRTPLNAIIGWTHILRRDAVRSGLAVHQALEVIERNARAQSRLIEDLLDVSQIISGKVRLDVQRVRLQSVIAAAIEGVRPAADAKGIRLQQTLDPIAAQVKGDPNRLQQVVWNLVNNAVKFTPRGGRVQVFLERVNSHLEIVVSDTGAGISPEFLPHVFDRFRQQDASSTRQAGGLGLGLAIVKELVELHGGTVRAKSPGRDQGSTFVVTLPLSPVHGSIDEDRLRAHPQAEPDLHADPCAHVPLDGVRVLVVDDDPDGREMVRQVLEACGASVMTAATAAEALDAIRMAVPDVVVTDIGMPGMDGYELVRELRALPPEQGGRVPVVALTAFARAGDRTRTLLAGFQMHLAKPIEASELIAAVASLAGRVAS